MYGSTTPYYYKQRIESTLNFNRSSENAVTLAPPIHLEVSSQDNSFDCGVRTLLNLRKVLVNPRQFLDQPVEPTAQNICNERTRIHSFFNFCWNAVKQDRTSMDSGITLEDVAVESDGFNILEEDKSKSSIVDLNQDFKCTRETVDDYISLGADSEARSTTGSEYETDMFLTDGSISIKELYKYDRVKNIRRSTSWSELNETSGWQDNLRVKNSWINLPTGSKSALKERGWRCYHVLSLL
ncbi:hypothetical protein SARC_15619 [Sphaeroforma arctica JP610]|uniref:Uncharacterized protein n=1 Tax=Sphaeroforma arctica JP610 TaxID=667725 RepID=A0A0L0F5F4_9EUKA|nr:hypothetical protein SARC_15619 [Sphaeroforma arctica JP610]KNC71839.1 hypothetical protein SARC_15619 [Sphaeroforma arctica JP610]|eukprot:XP_014145741.1 hypothetical protein SARC_15619 [Sphaeroforma arctica JP610]